jgi:hypothetical protein
VAGPKYSISVDQNDVTLSKDGATIDKFPVKARRITGAGIHARNIVEFEHGQLSYLDVYGCLSNVELLINTSRADLAREFPSKNFKCVLRGHGDECESMPKTK